MISKNHTIYRKDRNRHGGGVILGVRKDIKSFVTDITTQSFESITIKVYNKKEKFILSSIYIPPNMKSNQMTELKAFLKSLITNFKDYNIVICGDLNLDYLEKSKRFVKIFINTLNRLGLKQMVKTHTYPSNRTKSINNSLLDLIIVNKIENVSNIRNFESISKTCDHLLIDFQMNFSQKYHLNNEKYIMDYNNENDLQKFRQSIKDFDWSEIFNTNNDINTIYNGMIEMLTSLMNNCFQLKKLELKEKLDKSIKNLLKLKRKVYKVFYETRNEIYRIYGEHLFDKIKIKLEENNYNRYLKIINKSDNLKSLYKEIKRNKASNVCQIFKKNNILIDEVKEICENFSESFSEKYTLFDTPNYQSVRDLHCLSLNSFKITITDVLREIINLKANKSCLGSEIPTVLFKKCPETFSVIFSNLFQHILLKNKIPEKLKEVIVLPIYKKGKPVNSFESYRPITLENNILKLFCKLIFNNIISYVNENQIIPLNQYGFRPSISVYNQITDILHEITKAFNDKNVLCVDLIFLDMSNAFDRIPLKTLLENCYEIGLRNDCLKILEEYLIGRKQKIFYSGVYSGLKEITSGIPQGGVGSPDLFNISVRNFPKVTTFSKLFQFADDSCLLKVIYSETDINYLQIDLNEVQKYCDKMKFKLNAEKSIHLRISFKNCDNLKSYEICNKLIPTNKSHKHLGYIIDNRLSNNENVEYIYNTCLKKWSFLTKSFPFAKYDILLRLYKTYIIPITEFCNTSYVLNITQTMKIEKIQKKITKQICFKASNIYNTYEERLKLLDIKSLESRRKYSVIKIVYKCVNNCVGIPHEWKQMYKFNDNQRNGKILYKPFSRNAFSQKNFFNYSIDLFNSLPKTLRNEIHLKTFLINCKSIL